MFELLAMFAFRDVHSPYMLALPYGAGSKICVTMSAFQPSRVDDVHSDVHLLIQPTRVYEVSQILIVVSRNLL